MRVKGVFFGLLTAAALVFSAPAGAFVFNTPHDSLFEPPFGSLFDSRLLNLDAANSIPFNQSLNEGYMELSDDRGNDWKSPNWDFVDAELFKHKARTAARNSNPVPETPLDRDLSDSQVATFWAALNRMKDAFDRGGRYEAPRDAGVAQVKYDCWIEATEEGRADDVEACKAAFEAAMAEVEAAATYSLTEVGIVEPTQQAQAPAMQPQSFLVYFDFDQSDIRNDATATLDEVIAAASADPNFTVRVIAHTDTSGAIDYNQALSERRANAVVGSLIAGGVDRGRVVSEAAGETQPLVSTGDGVREQGNRVAEIDLL